MSLCYHNILSFLYFVDLLTTAEKHVSCHIQEVIKSALMNKSNVTCYKSVSNIIMYQLQLHTQQSP